MDRLASAGWLCDELNLPKVLREGREPDALDRLVASADLVVLSFPLYVDTAPAAVTAWMERVIRNRRRASGGGRPISFLMIVNSGFPEARHNETVLAIGRRFARDAGWEWLGGVAVPGGGALNGRAILPHGMTRNLCLALNEVADAVREGRMIPESAKVRLARPVVPRRLYLLIATMGWYRRAWHNGVGRLLRRAVLPGVQ